MSWINLSQQIFPHLFSFSSHLSQNCIFSSELINLRFQFLQFLPDRYTLNSVWSFFFLFFCRFGLWSQFSNWLFCVDLLKEEKQAWMKFTYLVRRVSCLKMTCGTALMKTFSCGLRLVDRVATVKLLAKANVLSLTISYWLAFETQAFWNSWRCRILFDVFIYSNHRIRSFTEVIPGGGGT